MTKYYVCKYLFYKQFSFRIFLEEIVLNNGVCPCMSASTILKSPSENKSVTLFYTFFSLELYVSSMSGICSSRYPFILLSLFFLMQLAIKWHVLFIYNTDIKKQYKWIYSALYKKISNINLSHNIYTAVMSFYFESQTHALQSFLERRRSMWVL